MQDGWYLHHVEGSHHWFAHADRTNRVTVEHPRRDIPIGTLRSNFSAGWMGLEDCERRMKYAIVVHKDPGSSYGVTVPSLPGCFSGGDTLDKAFANAREAIVCHIEGCLLEDQPIPKERPLEEYQANPDLRGRDVGLRRRRPVRLVWGISGQTRASGHHIARAYRHRSRQRGCQIWRNALWISGACGLGRGRE